MSRTKQILALVFVVCLLAAAGCGGSGGTPTTTPPPPPNFTPRPPDLLTPAPPPTIDGGMTLDPFTNKAPPYTISVPSGWTVSEGSAGLTTFSFSTPNRGLVAQTTINCATTLKGEADPDAVLKEDASLLNAVKAPIVPGKAQQLTINGRVAFEFPYSVNIGKSSAFQFVYYIAGGPCTWRIRNVVYGSTAGTGYDKLFSRMVDSFAPA